MNMKKKYLLAPVLFGASLLMNGCVTTPDKLRAMLEKNPEIIFEVIEKNPEKFMDVVNSAFQKTQMKQKEAAAAAESEEREKAFKDPLKPEIDTARAIRGSAQAPITIVEYSDFECSFCARGYQTLRGIEEKYKDKVRVVFKHLPLEFHQKAMPAAQWFEAIALQSPEKAYKFHDKIFENQERLKDHESFFAEIAKGLGLDLKKIKEDANSDKVKARIAADMAEAAKFGFSGTPGFLINGIALRGAYPQPEFEKIIDRLLLPAEPKK